MNRVMISGNIGSEPNVKAASNGSTYMRFSMAVHDRFKDKKTGEWTKKTNWFYIVAFGGLADLYKDKLAKGCLVMIDGELQSRKWKKDDGSEVDVVEIKANEIILGMRTKSENSNPQQRTIEDSIGNTKTEDDDNVPF